MNYLDRAKAAMTQAAPVAEGGAVSPAPPAADHSLPPNSDTITHANTQNRFGMFPVLMIVLAFAAFGLWALSPDLPTIIKRLKGDDQATAQKVIPGKSDESVELVPRELPPEEKPIPAIQQADTLKPPTEHPTQVTAIPAPQPTQPTAPAEPPAPPAPDLRYTGNSFVDLGLRSPLQSSGSNLSAPPVQNGGGNITPLGNTQQQEGGPNGSPSSRSTAASNDSVANRLQSARFTSATAYTLPDRSRVILAGRSIDCTIDDATDSSLPGIVTCTVARDAHSDDGSAVLIHKGAVAVGQYRGQLENGQTRIFITWNQIQDAGSIIEIDSPTADSLGRAGLEGEYDSKFWTRYKGALLLSTVQAIGGAAAGSAAIIATPAAGAASPSLQRDIDIPGVTRTLQGQRILIKVARNLYFQPRK